MNIGSAWLLNSTDGNGGQTQLDTGSPRSAPWPRTGRSPPTVVSSPALPRASSSWRGCTHGDKAGMSALVRAGPCRLSREARARAYPVYIAEYTSLTFLNSHPGLPRVDLVVVRVYDDPKDNGGTTAAVLEMFRASTRPPRSPRSRRRLSRRPR